MTRTPEDTKSQPESATAAGGNGTAWWEPLQDRKIRQNGAAIRALRERSNHSQRSLSAAVNTTQGWISHIENNNKPASMRLLARIARELRVPLSAVTREDAA
jgi:DNA-binding XRE family transcriptional regulator